MNSNEKKEESSSDCMYCGGDHSSFGCPQRDEILDRCAAEIVPSWEEE